MSRKIQFTTTNEIKIKLEKYLEWGTVAKVFNIMLEEMIEIYEKAEIKGIDKHLITAMILSKDISLSINSKRIRKQQVLLTDTETDKDGSD